MNYDDDVGNRLGILRAFCQVFVGGYNWMLAVYYSAYKELTVNVFALSSTWLTVVMAVSSTWLTVVMAVSRYVVVCRPLCCSL